MVWKGEVLVLGLYCVPFPVPC